MPSPDAVRLLAVAQLERARDLLPSSASPQEAVVRAYNEQLSALQLAPLGTLHPDQDAWILAHHAALGALHEPTLDPRLSTTAVIDYAIATLEMLIGAPKSATKISLAL